MNCGANPLDDEMVPLSVAATVTYFHLIEDARRGLEDRLAEVAHLVAIALSTVAPLKAVRGEWSAKEIENLLFRGLDGQRVDLDDFAIRRGDLRAALAALKEAHAAKDSMARAIQEPGDEATGRLLTGASCIAL